GHAGEAPAGRGEDLVAVAVGHADVAEDGVEGGVSSGGDRFQGGDGPDAALEGLDQAAPVVEHIVDDAPDVDLVVGDEHTLARQGGVDLPLRHRSFDAQQGLGAGGDVADAAVDGLD